MFVDVTIEDATEAIIDYRGKTPPKSETGIKLLTAKVIKNGTIDESRLEFISEETYSKWMRRGMPQSQDVLLTTEAPLGEVTILRSTERIALAQRVILLRAAPDRVDPRYLFAAMRSPIVQSRLHARATGTTVLGIKQSELRKVEIPVPPMAVQEFIGATVSAYDELIENNTRRIKILEEMAQSIYKEWFVNFRYPGDENVPLVDSELGPIPEGWDLRVLNELVTSQYGYTESTSVTPVGPKFLRGMDINKTSYIDWDAVPYCPIDDKDLLKFRLAHGDVLIIRMADPGKVGIVERDVEAVFASYLVRLRPVDSNYLDPYFLFYYANSDSYQGFITGASTGTTRKSISAKVMTSPNLVTPPPPVQLDFRATVEPIRELMGNLVQANTALRAARDLLLPRLVSGEIDVSGAQLAAEPLSSS